MNEKILIIDDEDLLREGIGAELSCEGFDVIEASNGKEGFQIAKKIVPDLILCDVNMPGTDGYETFRLLRSEAVTSNIPVIFMTGVMEEYPRIRNGMNRGADDCIAKPFSIDDLLTSIRTTLSKKGK